MVNYFDNRLMIQIITKKRCCKNDQTNNASDNSQHKNRICHRALKPGNFMFASKKDGSAAKLVDFGFSRSFCKFEWRGGQVPACADEGGTARCMAPEILRQNYSYACNAFSAETSFASALSYPSSVSSDNEEAFKFNSKATITFMAKFRMKYLM